MSRLRILIADDHVVVLEGLKRLLSDEFQVLAGVETGQALIRESLRFKPDVIIADLALPDIHGLDVLAQLRRLGNQSKFIFLTMHNEAAYARRAFQAGADGYILKHASMEALTEAIKKVAAGETYLSPGIALDLNNLSQ